MRLKTRLVKDPYRVKIMPPVQLVVMTANAWGFLQILNLEKAARARQAARFQRTACLTLIWRVFPHRRRGGKRVLAEKTAWTDCFEGLFHIGCGSGRLQSIPQEYGIGV